MKGSNVLLQNMTGSAGGFVATTAKDGDTILRASPKRGNQGKDEAHIPAQTKARAIGEITKRSKNTFRNTFTDRPVLLSAANVFQKYNMTAANGVFDANNVIQWDKVRVSDGDTTLSGLTVANAAYTAGVADEISCDVSFNVNANGANIELRGVVMSTDLKESKIVTFPVAQNGAAATITANVDGYEDPALYLFWYDTVNKSASTSLFVLHQS